MKICGERNASGPRLRSFGLAATVAIFSAVAPLSRNVGVTVNALDPSAYVITALLLAGVSLSAMLVPARRATGVDPMTVLRDEYAWLFISFASFRRAVPIAAPAL
jgi:hypothetical protein